MVDKQGPAFLAMYKMKKMTAGSGCLDVCLKDSQMGFFFQMKLNGINVLLKVLSLYLH